MLPDQFLRTSLPPRGQTLPCPVVMQLPFADWPATTSKADPGSDPEPSYPVGRTMIGRGLTPEQFDKQVASNSLPLPAHAGSDPAPFCFLGQLRI